MSPWCSYRVEIDEMIDLGDSVLVLVCDYGRRAAGAPEVESASAAVWTVHDGKVAAIAFWADRKAAFRASGVAR